MIKRDLSCVDFLEELITREVEARHVRMTAMKATMARFPFHKTLESFDVRFHLSINPKAIRELAMADAANVLLLGLPASAVRIRLSMGGRQVARGCILDLGDERQC